MTTEDRDRQLRSGLAHQQAGRLSQAEKIYKRLLKRAPRDFDCTYLLGMLYAHQGRFDAAIEMLSRAADIRPDVPDAQYNLAVALGMAGHHERATRVYERILQINPRHGNARNNYATSLLHLGRLTQALSQYDALVALNPGAADAYNNRGMAREQAKRFTDALADYDKAISLKPNFPEAFVNRGNALQALRRADDALADYRKAIALRPDFSSAYSNIGNIYFHRGHYPEAIEAYDRALSLNADDSEARGMRLYARLNLCDWSDVEAEREQLLWRIHRGAVIYPFIGLALSSSLDEQFQYAKSFSRARYPLADPPLWRGEAYAHDRIRIAYVSADFREHATANLLVGVFEHHDKSRFEITGLSFVPSDRSAMARRIESACERFVDVGEKSDRDIADLLRQLEIDIVIDAMGYTQGARPGIFTCRAAPVQASYLGYLGTTGSDFIDYVIGDRVVLPLDSQKHFSEKIVHLPDCFLSVDDHLEVTSNVPSRSDLGLPQDSFVFCSLNNGYKFGKTSFGLWMRLLRNIPGSVLWLLESNRDMIINLRREAEQCGIEADRIVFAPRLPLSAHLARQRAADLFLDTSPYNAGATAALALWAGVPILTLLGETFVGRMAASMLHSVGLPDLVAASWSEYEMMALRIGTDSSYCASLKDRLGRARGSSALFDPARFTRHLEAAYTAMWTGSRNGILCVDADVKP